LCVPARLSTVPVNILNCSVCVPARLSKVPVTILHYSVCVPARQSTVPVTILHYSVCVPARLSTVPVNILNYSVCVQARLSTVPVTILHYSVCVPASSLQFLSPYCITVCVSQQGCLQFLSPYCIILCVPARLSTVPFTILHYSVCASKAVYSFCHHTTLQCVCQQGCLQFQSPYCITVCVPVRLSTVPVTILHYSVCASKAVYSSCHHTALHCVCNKALYSSFHHTALQSVCQQGSVQFLSPYFITVCVPARLLAVPVTILHYSVCTNKALYSSCHHTALQCVCQQGSVQFLSPYCISLCVSARLSAVCCCVTDD